MTASNSRVTTWTILRAHWYGTRGRRIFFAGAVISFALFALAGVFLPILYKELFDGFESGATVSELVNILYILVAVLLAEWAAGRTGYMFLNTFESKVMSRLAQDALDYLLYHSYSFYQNNFTGSLVQRVRRFAGAFERLCDTLVMTLIPISVTLIGAIVVVYQQKPILAYIMVAWVCTFLIFNYIFSQFKLPYDLKRAALDSETTAVLADVITNHNAVTLFTSIEKESKTFADVTDRRARAMWMSWTLGTLFDGAQALLMIGITFAVFYVTIQYWAVGAVSIGTFVLVQVYIIQLSSRMWDLGRVIRQVYEGFADSREMVEILSTPYDVHTLPGARDLTVSEARIEFKDVTFNYNETRTVLNNISLAIPSAQKVALVGPSGAGKSTFVRLLLRLYDTTAGVIAIDGQDIKQVTLDSLRGSIAFVPQDPVLFHRTLMENIRYGRPTATDEEVVAAAKLAHCDEFIDVLPDKYETFVGERGVKLSGGERQRVAIARAILKNAPILILDEATSSLDSHSEAMIQDALDTLMRGKTVMVIAHRLSTIRKMDRIIVIDEGKIREDGTHDELLKTDGSLYRGLWELQAGGFLADSAKEESQA